MKRRLIAWGMAVLTALSLTACGGPRESASPASPDMAPMESPGAMEEKLDYGVDADYPAGGEDGARAGQKMIRRAELQLETLAFEEAVAGLAALTEQMGGYYEISNVAQRGDGYRWAEYTVRVPVERYAAFLDQAGTLCHETWCSATQEDISEVYYDTQGRLKTQQIKLERLHSLLEQAESMEDIITIESAISETELRIEELSGSLQHYDALVDYATVQINLDEVYKLSNVEETPTGFGSRMAQAFAGGLRGFADSLEALAVALAYSWLWLLVAGLILICGVRLTRRAKTGEGLHISLKRKKKDDNGGER